MNFLIPNTPLRNIVFVIIIIIIAIVIDMVLRSLVRVPKRIDTRRSRTFVSVLRNMITFLVYIIAAHIVFILLGINLTPLLASAGIAGIAIGLGARPLIEDLIAGLFLLTQASIGIGDYVSLADTEGYIENIGIRTLSIRDVSGALHIIPNGLIKQVVNFSRGSANVLIDIPVKPDHDIDMLFKTATAAIEIVKKDKELGKYVSPSSKVLGIEDILADGTIIIRIRIVTDSSKRFAIARAFRYSIAKNFEKIKTK